MRIRLISLLALGLAFAPAAGTLGLACAPSALGFVPLRTSGGTDYAWDLDSSRPNVVDGVVTYYIGTRTTDSLAVRATMAIEDGIRAWSQAPHTRIAFRSDSSRPASSHNSSDNVNLVEWVSGKLGPYTLASTYPTHSAERITDTIGA